MGALSLTGSAFHGSCMHSKAGQKLPHPANWEQPTTCTIYTASLVYSSLALGRSGQQSVWLIKGQRFIEKPTRSTRNVQRWNTKIYTYKNKIGQERTVQFPTKLTFKSITWLNNQSRSVFCSSLDHSNVHAQKQIIMAALWLWHCCWCGQLIDLV